MAAKTRADRLAVLSGAGGDEPGDAPGVVVDEPPRLAAGCPDGRGGVSGRQPRLGGGHPVRDAAGGALYRLAGGRHVDDFVHQLRGRNAEPVAGLRLLGARATAVRDAWPAGAARPVRDLWPEGGVSDPRCHHALLFAAGIRFPSALSTAFSLPPAAVDGAVASGAGGAGGAHFLYQPQRRVDLYRHHRQRGGAEPDAGRSGAGGGDGLRHYRRRRRGPARHPAGRSFTGVVGLRPVDRQRWAADRPAAAGALRHRGAAV